MIIGGGHNGLVCAAYLAKAGRKVTVLEAADQVGGAAATREFSPGFRASMAHLLYLLDDGIAKDLALESNGLKMARANLQTIALAPDGNHLTIRSDGVDGTGVSQEDRAAYTEYRRFMSKFAGVIGALHNQVPPRITDQRGDLMALGKLALKIRMLGRDDMREFLRIAGINIFDILQEEFRQRIVERGAQHGRRARHLFGAALQQLGIHSPASHERQQRGRGRLCFHSRGRHGRGHRRPGCGRAGGRGGNQDVLAGVPDPQGE